MGHSYSPRGVLVTCGSGHYVYSNLYIDQGNNASGLTCFALALVRR